VVPRRSGVQNPVMASESLDRAIAVTEAELGDLDLRRAAAVERLAALSEQRQASRAATSDVGGPPVGWSAVRKVELFRSLFRGRDDVFAVRWENASTRRSGHAPRCANEWKRGVCEKPRVRCGACPNQAFMALNATEVRRHLQGRQVVGIYPLLADETCWLLVIDLDGESWPDDVAALRRAATRIGVEPAVERSRSREGAHVWFFFASPVSATEARELGELLLTRAMPDSPSLGMDSYDRLFPSQNTLPAGGFGNLIVLPLPLQHAARQCGNSLFVDERCEPYTDQWAFLDSLPRASPERLDEVLAEARVTDHRLGVAEPDSDARAP
jgi:hypothetical protein